MLQNIILFDKDIERTVLLLRDDFWNQAFFFVTHLGHWLVIVFLFLICAGIWLRRGHKEFVLPLATILIGAGAMAVGVKELVDRARPDADVSLYTETLSSFPSGHAAIVMALFGFLIYRVYQSNVFGIGKHFLIALFILLIVTVGFSRLYLGVHFFSDVVGGYLIGLFWVLSISYLTRK